MSCWLASGPLGKQSSRARKAMFAAHNKLWRCAQQNLADVGTWLARRTLAVMAQHNNFNGVANWF